MAPVPLLVTPSNGTSMLSLAKTLIFVNEQAESIETHTLSHTISQE